MYLGNFIVQGCYQELPLHYYMFILYYGLGGGGDFCSYLQVVYICKVLVKMFE